jgi:hypothetical protein
MEHLLALFVVDFLAWSLKIRLKYKYSRETQCIPISVMNKQRCRQATLKIFSKMKTRHISSNLLVNLKKTVKILSSLVLFNWYLIQVFQ